MHKQIVFIILVSILSVGHSVAQQGSRGAAVVQTISNPGTGIFHYVKGNEPPRAIEFEERTVTSTHFLSNVNSYLNIPAEFTFAETESNTDNLGIRHRLLQQYYKGIPLEGMLYRVHEKDGFVRSANGRAVRAISLDTRTTFSESQAFESAKMSLGSKDTTVRLGRMLIVSKDFRFTPESFFIAFQFDIDVSLIERWRISIDARDGNVINKVSLVHNCSQHESRPLPFGSGTGLTRYYGRQNIKVETKANGSSRMTGQTDNGGEIGTYDFHHASIYALLFGFDVPVYNFTSSTNTYDSDYQKVAVTVQWGMEKAYEYYFKTHGRDSYDNNGATITSYVHVDNNLDNAFWTGKLLAFGDGSNNNPLVELDVVSHELTHGVTQYEAGLAYSYESGALNESFSDIFGKAVEFDAFGDSATWQLAKHFRDGGLRDLSNPNLKNQPDTYQGDLWHTSGDDNGGVHYNSGVQNFWFYLLCEGGSGVNDHQTAYSINAIGIEAASKIAYRNLTEYLSTTSDYMDSRVGSLLAAADLYGKNSTIYKEVAKAWNAVGVIDEPIVTSFEVYDITGTTVKLRGNLLPRGTDVTYHFEYGTTPSLGSTTSTVEYIDKVEGVITGLQSETRYYVQLVATNEHGNSYAYSGFTTISLAPLVRIKQTVDVTETSAILHGEVNPNSLPTSFYFEYGTTPAFGSVTPSFSMPDATEFLDVSAPVINLQPRQTYYYRLVATNSAKSSPSGIAKFFAATRPVINSYSPASSPIDAEITITGKNFNPVSEMNIVTFGAVRAAVVSSSSTEVKVKVPSGASLGTINLLDSESGLSAESIEEFVPTFTGEFTKESLQLTTGMTDLYSYQSLVQDMDGDGRPDIITRQYYGFTILQNVNQGGDITSESFIRNTFSLANYTNFHLADFDGNGLQDIIGQYNEGFRIYPNLSAPGFIFFGTPVDIKTGWMRDYTVNDFDQDGRPDLACVSYLPGDNTGLVIFRNQNPKGSLTGDNFKQKYSSVLPYFVYNVYDDDLNNDGKSDLLFATFATQSLPILINNTREASFEFEMHVAEDATRANSVEYTSQDLNRDGWKDIIGRSTVHPGNLGIIQNKGTAPTSSFNSPVVVLSDHVESILQPGDMNGDGNVDLVVGINEGKFVLLTNKTAVAENLNETSFEEFSRYGIEQSNGNQATQSSMVISDLNRDGRPDVFNSHANNYDNGGYSIEIWQNTPENCPDASGITVDASRLSAILVLPSDVMIDQFQIEYRPEGATYWWQSSSTVLYYLDPGTRYEVRARSRCKLGFGQYHYLNFTTDCADMSGLSITNIGATSAWVAAYNLNELEVQYAPVGEEQFKTLPLYVNDISGLIPGTIYNLRFRGRCPTSDEFEFRQFTTLCPQLSDIVVANVTYNKAEVTWSSYYAGNAILEYSADQLNWIRVDETQTISPLLPGKEYSVRGTFTCTEMQSEFIYKSFTTPCPKVSMLVVDEIKPFSVNVSWSDTSATGTYTVSYSMIGGPVNIVTVSSTFLNIQDLHPGTDYRVSVAPQCSGAKEFTTTMFRTNCFVPANLTASAITHTTAEVSWNDDFDGILYSFDYSISGSNIWLTMNTNQKTISLSELRPGTEYEVRVHITCLSETAGYASLRFETSLFEKTTFFPNPTGREITIHPSKNLIGNRYIILDNMGRNVGEGELLAYTFDMSFYPAGIYTLKIEGEQPLRIVKH